MGTLGGLSLLERFNWAPLAFLAVVPGPHVADYAALLAYAVEAVVRGETVFFHCVQGRVRSAAIIVFSSVCLRMCFSFRNSQRAWVTQLCLDSAICSATFLQQHMGLNPVDLLIVGL